MKYWKFVFGVIYTFGYAASAFLALGFGKGSGVFLSPLVGGFGLSWVAMLVGLHLSANVESQKGMFLFLALMLSHYVLTGIWLAISWSGNLAGTENLLRHQPSVVWLNVIVYLAGQVIIWSAFVGQLKNNRNSKLS